MLYVILSSILLVASAPAPPLHIASNSPITLEKFYVDEVSEGDLWHFPYSNLHSVQAKDTAELLLAFDSGSFNEDSTFSLTNWLAHTPKEVLAKNFQVDIAKFDHIPDCELELYIIPCA
jgi:hypothetical protein